MCVAWRSTHKSLTSSPAALMTTPSKSGTSNQGRAYRPWRGTTGTYLLPLALLIFKVVLFAHFPAMRSTVWSVEFDPSGKKLVSGSSDNTVKVWSVGSSGTFECESTLPGHTGYVPAFPCSACIQSRGVCSLSSDEQAGLLRRV